MAVNKVVVGDEVKLDLTGDSITPGVLRSGETAHDAAGEPIVGTMVVTDPNEGNRGPFIITGSQTVDLAALGCRIGGPLNVICIGGGGGGGGSHRDSGGAGGNDGPGGSAGDGGKAGTGYGAGGGGAGPSSSQNEGDAGGGGGSGYMQKKSIIIDALSVPVTIGGAGGGGERGYAGYDPGGGGNGGTTSFGTYLSAGGGYGGGGAGGSTGGVGSGGAGGNSGEDGKERVAWAGTPCSGGKGGDGWTNNGTFVADNSAGNTLSGSGCVMIWY